MNQFAILAALAALGAASAASAESFTFTSTSKPGTLIVGATPAGTPVTAGTFTATAKATYASGKAVTSTADCAQWSTFDDPRFQIGGLCVYTESSGDKASIVFSCSATKPDQSEANCWGALTGMAGSRAKKTGTISWHATAGAGGAGSGGSATGVGLWND